MIKKIIGYVKIKKRRSKNSQKSKNNNAKKDNIKEAFAIKSNDDTQQTIRERGYIFYTYIYHSVKYVNTLKDKTNYLVFIFFKNANITLNKYILNYIILLKNDIICAIISKS